MGFRDKASQWAKQNILSLKQEVNAQGQQQRLGGVGDINELHFQVSQKRLCCEVLGQIPRP